MTLFDRIRDTSTTTATLSPTTTFTVSGSAPSGFQTFSARFVSSPADSNIPVVIAHQTANEWQVCWCSYTASNTLRVDTIIASSNADSGVAFSAGTKDVFVANSSKAVAALRENNTFTGTNIFPNTGLKILESGGSPTQTLTIAPGSALTADRTLTIATGDADRTLDISAGNVTISTAGAALIDDVDASAQRTTLGLAIGTNVQAYDADLAALAGLSTNGMIARTGAGTAAVRSIAAGTGITVTNGDGVAGNPTVALTSNTISGVALGNNLNTLTLGTGLGGTSYNGSGAVTASVTYGTTSTTACVGNDARLSDARTPTDGSVTNAKMADMAANTIKGVTTTGAPTDLSANSAITVLNTATNTLDFARLDGVAASSHTHGNISNAGAIGSTANLPVITTTSGVLTTGTFGTTANTFTQGNDSRLSDTRTPTDGTVTNAKVTSTFADGIESSKLRFTQTGTGAVARSVDAKLKDVVSVTDFGAKGDCQTFTGAASITSGQATLTVTGANFTSADVGKRVFVGGAGTAGAPLLTTVSALTNSTTLTLANNAATTVTNVVCVIGTNDTTAIQNAITAASATGAPLFIAQGVYGVSSLTCSGGLRLYGPGTVAFDASAGAGLTVEPTRSASTSVSAISNVQFPASTGIESGAGQLTVASSANFRRGDICHLRSTDDAPGVAAANAAELVQVSEITNGTTIVLTAPVVGSYTTSVALEKLNAAPVEIDGPTFTFFGDSSALTAEPTRFVAVLLVGCVYPTVFATFKDDVCAGLVVLSCWRPNVDVSTVNLRTSSSVQYYGYGVGAYGATRGGTFNIRADRVRHAYTDGVWSTGSGDIRWGTALDNVVSGLATNCQMASWDTHPGAINTVFQNCGVYDSTTNNDQTSKDTIAAFQDRGLNTRFINCWSIGSRRPFFLTAGRETYGVANTTTVLGGYFERRGTSNGYLCFPDKTGSDTYKAEFHGCKIVRFEPAQQAPGYNILSFFGCDFLQDGTAGINASNDFGGMIFRDCTFREFGVMRLGQSNNHVFQFCKRINSGSSVEPMIVGVGSTVDVHDYYAEAASYGNSSIIRAGAGSDSGTVTLNVGRLSAKNYTHASHLSTNGVCTLVTNTNANFLAFADGSAVTPSITNSGDENTGLFFPAADSVAISTGGTERLTIDSSGRVGVNITSPSDALALYGASNALVNIRGDDTTGFTARRYNDTGTGAQNNLQRARGTFASPTAVANSDTCGIFTFGAHDGGDFRTVAMLQGSVVTYTGSNDVSGRLSFWTRPSGAGASVAERMRLDHNGAVTVFGAQTVRVDNATNSGVTTAAILSHTTTGTPANGIGTALDFEAETSNSNNEIGARISAVTTDVTAASEDFDLVFYTMAAGAAVSERARMKSTGQFRFIPLTADPAGAEDGDVYYNSSTNKLRVRANGSWVDLH